jgi:hypothetical protein
MRRGDSKEMNASGQVVAGPHNLLGYLLGTDAVNDPRFSIHNGTDETGKKVVPSITYDASQMGANGAMFSFFIPCMKGIYFYKESGVNDECMVYYEKA